MSTKPVLQKNRLVVLDHLRGFFIVVIIIDHLGRWPSFLSVFTGQALLWVTAAEGFVIISGLLIGYIRGFKNRLLSLKEVSIKLWRRALLLYVCSIIASLIYTSLIWYAPIVGGLPLILIEKGNWAELIFKTLTLQYTYMWVYFLTLYAVFLAASPLAIWLMRRQKSWVVILLSLGIFIVGRIFQIEAMQWQALFFIPSVAGFHLEKIQAFWKRLMQHARVLIQVGAWALTLLTILVSVYFTFYADLSSSQTISINMLFDRENIGITPLRLVLAFVWFIGLFFLFQAVQRWIGKYLNWLLLPFGTRSLSAYIIHGLVIVAISMETFAGESVLFNTALGIICVLSVWALLKIPFIQKIIPT